MFTEFFRRSDFVALACAVVAALCTAFWQSERATARALAEHGVTATATVVDKHRETTRTRTDHGTRTDTDYMVTYAYDALATDGTRTPLRITHDVPKAIYDEHAMGEEVEIRYLLEHPARADVFPGETARGSAAVGIFAGMAAIAAAVSARIRLKLARRARRLDLAGLRTTGTVESVNRSKRGATLGVRFTDAQGDEHLATARAARSAPTFRAGADVPLLYDPADPTNVALA